MNAALCRFCGATAVAAQRRLTWINGRGMVLRNVRTGALWGGVAPEGRRALVRRRRMQRATFCGSRFFHQ
jgi:hypothetical protein